MNTSNGSIAGEFTFWREAMAIILTSELLLIYPASLFLNISIIVTISKTKQLRKLINLIHQSLLLLNCLIIVADIITTFFFVPRAIRFCECSQTASSAYFLIELFYIVFQPLNYACLGIFQLLIIKGKKKLVSYPTIGASITFCLIVTILVAAEGVILVNLAGQTYICDKLCPQLNTAKFSGTGITFYTVMVVSWLPSVVIVIVCTSWSCLTFKKRYTGGDDDLNRRVLSLPIVLPTTVAVPNLLTLAFLKLIEQTLESSEAAESIYWTIFAKLFAFQVHEVLSGIVYPCILLRLSPQIRRYWKEQLLKRRICRKSNVVTPTSSAT